MNKNIEKLYLKYKVQEISDLFFSYDTFEKIIGKFKSYDLIDVKKIGKSFEKRNLYLLKIGKGEQNVFAWSQMHGNEPVSTMSLFDFMSFLMSDEDDLTAEQELFLNECTFYFFPLVNPDGAEKFSRRNLQGIDLNRDALKMTAPESKVLNNIIDEIQPDFAFNLHDQERYYGTNDCTIPTIMSFLSPSFDFSKTIDSYRESAMQVISDIYSNLKNNLTQGIAKYNDAYMPNAFGDNVQKKKISTILR
ncbi:MAG: M14 family zinc carboxypeptidase [Bacteroidota bacterium]|nr:M14 family zinc carboxypeptidase [Bacteroidota bacterium]